MVFWDEHWGYRANTMICEYCNHWCIRYHGITLRFPQYDERMKDVNSIGLKHMQSFLTP